MKTTNPVLSVVVLAVVFFALREIFDHRPLLSNTIESLCFALIVVGVTLFVRETRK